MSILTPQGLFPVDTDKHTPKNTPVRLPMQFLEAQHPGSL